VNCNSHDSQRGNAGNNTTGATERWQLGVSTPLDEQRDKIPNLAPLEPRLGLLDGRRNPVWRNVRVLAGKSFFKLSHCRLFAQVSHTDSVLPSARTVNPNLSFRLLVAL
jgi:hypothetical protein